ncbi:MAG: hypothetical protein JSR53_11970 [Proteobacteria bacterium]|nr:hypothetical protein [Pseudomonadota bacterium]
MGMLQAIKNAWCGLDDDGASTEDLRQRLEALNIKHRNLLDAPAVLAGDCSLTDRIQALQIKHDLLPNSSTAASAIHANAFGGVGEAGYGYFQNASTSPEIVGVLFANSSAAREGVLFPFDDESDTSTTSAGSQGFSFVDDGFDSMLINPATGLPMCGICDVAGNPFGSNLNVNSSSFLDDSIHSYRNHQTGLMEY